MLPLAFSVNNPGQRPKPPLRQHFEPLISILQIKHKFLDPFIQLQQVQHLRDFGPGDTQDACKFSLGTGNPLIEHLLILKSDLYRIWVDFRTRRLQSAYVEYGCFVHKQLKNIELIPDKQRFAEWHCWGASIPVVTLIEPFFRIFRRNVKGREASSSRPFSIYACFYWLYQHFRKIIPKQGQSSKTGSVNVTPGRPVVAHELLQRSDLFPWQIGRLRSDLHCKTKPECVCVSRVIRSYWLANQTT